MKILLILFLFILSSCGFSFDVENESDTTVEKIELCNSFLSDNTPQILKENIFSVFNTLFAESFTKVVEEVEKRDTWSADEVTLKFLELIQDNIPVSIKSSNSLGIIKNIQIYIKFKDNYDKVLLTSIDSSKIDATSINFITKNVNLVPYINKGFEIKVNTEVRDCPTEDIKFTSKFIANIKI